MMQDKSFEKKAKKKMLKEIPRLISDIRALE